MLGKLIKYDLQSALKKLGPLYLALLALSVLAGISIRFSVTENWVFTIIMIVYFITMIVCWAIPIFILASHFRRNLMEEEGYLMFSLPVSTLEHIVAKVISALICLVTCSIAVALSFGIIGLIAADMNDIKALIEAIGELLSMDIDYLEITKNAIKVMIMMILGSVQIITQIYAAIAIGHLVKDHETLGAVGAFIGMSAILSFIVNQIPMPDFMTAFWPFYLEAAIVIVIFTVITWIVLDRNLNLA